MIRLPENFPPLVQEVLYISETYGLTYEQAFWRVSYSGNRECQRMLAKYESWLDDGPVTNRRDEEGLYAPDYVETAFHHEQLAAVACTVVGIRLDGSPLVYPPIALSPMAQSGENVYVWRSVARGRICVKLMEWMSSRGEKRLNVEFLEPANENRKCAETYHSSVVVAADPIAYIEQFTRKIREVESWFEPNGYYVKNKELT